MNRWVHRARKLATGLGAMAMALLYLLISTQLAFPLGEQIEAAFKTAVEAEAIVQGGSVVRKEAFACALHKCGCKNADQCRTSCCCFPKGSLTRSADGSHSGDGSHSHGAGRGEDHLTQYQACNGPEGHEHGLPPLLSAHLLPRPTALPVAVTSRGPLPAVMDRLLSPFSEVPQKIPI